MTRYTSGPLVWQSNDVWVGALVAARVGVVAATNGGCSVPAANGDVQPASHTARIIPRNDADFDLFILLKYNTYVNRLAQKSRRNDLGGIDFAELGDAQARVLSRPGVLQDGNNLLVAVLPRVRQRRHPLAICQVYIRPSFDQETDNLGATRTAIP